MGLVPSHAAFRALGDETRRDILTMLRSGPRTSGEIADQFNYSWPTISRHLAILRDAGLVIPERKGQEIYYELNSSVFQDLVQHLMTWIHPTPPGRAKGRLRKRTSKPQEG